jgi:hypothetical protein
MARVFSDVARGFSRSQADTYRLTGGLSGELGGNLSWDAYYQYGRTDRLQTVDNNLVVAGPTPFFTWAADAVDDPVTGAPTCRALLSPDPALRAAAAGCVPVNLFGTGTQVNWFFGGTYGQVALSGPSHGGTRWQLAGRAFGFASS